MSDPCSNVPAFLDVAVYAGEVVASAAVAEAWEQPSALERMTVGAVAGHLFLVVRRVDKHLDEPEATGTPARYRWLRMEKAEDFNNDDHRLVRADGAHVAAWGWKAVQSAYADRVNQLIARPRRHPFV